MVIEQAQHALGIDIEDQCVGALLQQQEVVARDMDRAATDGAAEGYASAGGRIEIIGEEVVVEAVQMFVIVLGLLKEETEGVRHTE